MAAGSTPDAVGTRVLIAGVGYQFMRDLSVGPVLVPELQRMDWPPGVEVDDWSIGPIHIVQRVEAQPRPYDRIVLFAAVERGREPGRVSSYRWLGNLPEPEEIQQRVGEAVMGVIHLDNLLIVGQQFGALPADVVVVEIEPEDTGWGAGFTPRIESVLGETVATVRRFALDGYDD